MQPVAIAILAVGVGLLFASAKWGHLIGPGLGSVATAIYLWPEIT